MELQKTIHPDVDLDLHEGRFVHQHREEKGYSYLLTTDGSFYKCQGCPCQFSRNEIEWRAIKDANV